MYSTVVFVGDHPLVVACAGRARDAGLNVTAVSTSDGPIAAWAEAEGIARVAWTDLGEYLRQHTTDVLLSVGNLRILPDDIVDATKATINFHDGPLPKFAGLHTPMWALLAGETEYEVTWHRVEGGIDEGDILATEGFEIDHDETTRSMNIKCMGAAGAAFNEVLRQLTTGSLEPKQQVGAGQYFGRYDRPIPASAIVPHAMTAERIQRYVRALDFGPTINRVGRPLLQVDATRLMVIRAVTPVLSSVDASPGQVLDAASDGGFATLTIATTTDTLEFTGWLEPGVDIAALVGSALPDPTPALADIEKLHNSSARSEVWQSKRLAAMVPADVGDLGESGDD
ncbi:MAG: formyltransferase family protein, partial [Acidimicrobiales bacterium]